MMWSTSFYSIHLSINVCRLLYNINSPSLDAHISPSSHHSKTKIWLAASTRSISSLQELSSTSCNLDLPCSALAASARRMSKTSSSGIFSTPLVGPLAFGVLDMRLPTEATTPKAHKKHSWAIRDSFLRVIRTWSSGSSSSLLRVPCLLSLPALSLNVARWWWVFVHEDYKVNRSWISLTIHPTSLLLESILFHSLYHSSLSLGISLLQYLFVWHRLPCLRSRILECQRYLFGIRQGASLGNRCNWSRRKWTCAHVRWSCCSCHGDRTWSKEGKILRWWWKCSPWACTHGPAQCSTSIPRNGEFDAILLSLLDHVLIAHF